MYIYTEKERKNRERKLAKKGENGFGEQISQQQDK